MVRNNWISKNSKDYLDVCDETYELFIKYLIKQ